MKRQKLRILSALAIFIGTIFLASASYATEEYAEQTGAQCRICHIDPLGGGELTDQGQGYLLSTSPQAAQDNTRRNRLARIVKLTVGYIHIITAFLWFGTILYVHLVLKPAYASKGLPRGEVRVGLVSMAVMAVTGIILTYYKVPSINALVSSRFGILLLVKIALFAIMVSSAMLVVFVIGPKLKKKKIAPPASSDAMTLAELASFDGREGRPAYFAFKEKIYDVTGSKLWKNGRHMMRHEAGVDLTDILAQAPHGEEKISAMPVVATLSPEKKTMPGEPHKRIFYAMAYMNLGFVFIISFILALWRWY